MGSKDMLGLECQSGLGEFVECTCLLDEFFGCVEVLPGA